MTCIPHAVADTTCSMDGCEKPITNSNRQRWCRMHHARWERHGDPTIVLPTSKPRGEYPAYRTMHQRVAKAKGRAKDHSCVACGGPAANWAYDHADPDEVTGHPSNIRALCAYSLKIEHYQPMCRSCHNVFDVRAKRERVAS